MEKFNYEANGYNRMEVNQFVRDVIQQTEGIIAKCQKQNRDIQELKAELKHYQTMEEDLKKSMIKAETASENIKQMAKEESNLILSDAKHNANRIVNEALLKAEKIEQEADTLQKNMKLFKRKLRIVIEQQLAVVEEIETLELE